jgi:hypothetical protein
MRLPIAFALTLTSVFAGTSSEPSQAQIDDIINKFAAKEAEFSKARSNYTYRQTVKLQELDESGGPMGKWELVSDIIFTPKRIERVVYAPVTTLQAISISPEDEQDLRDVQPFVLTTTEISQYNIRYLGRQKLDEISCYTFAVKPKTMEKGKRYFEGTVWVDDEDLQIVKTYGRGIGILKKSSDQAFPKFETYREQIDGKYWFPTYTIANDTLQFKEMSQRIRMSVKYENYKMFKSESVIKYGDEVEQPKPPEAKPPETKPPKKP